MYVILALVLLLPLVKQLTGRRRKREDSKIKKPQNVPPHRLSRTLSKTSLFAQFFSFSFFFNKTLQAKCISLHIWGSTLQHPLASLWVSVKKYTLIFSPWVKNILASKPKNQEEGLKTSDGDKPREEIKRTLSSSTPWQWREVFGKATFYTVLFFLSPFHHLGHKTGDGRGGLVRVQLGKQVADVVCCASLFPGHKPKQPDGDRRYIFKFTVRKPRPLLFFKN